MDAPIPGVCPPGQLRPSGAVRILPARVSILSVMLVVFACLSGLLMLWQWCAAVGFHLEDRRPVPARSDGSSRQSLPSVSVLKPIRGADEGTAEALATWMHQDYGGDYELIFGVENEADPAVPLIRALLAQYPGVPAQLVLCPDSLGANRKVSNLIQMARRATGRIIVVSDADVAAASDLVTQMILPLAADRSEVGLVHCLYRLADSPTLATRWEAFVVNADFWSQVLQNQTLQPLDYALGAAMALRRADLEAAGGFASLANHLADDNRLGRLIVSLGRRTELCPIVVDCRAAPAGWRDVWRHQLRWAITIRVCRPVAYFFSILANGTLWPLLWISLTPSVRSLAGGLTLLAFRVLQGLWLEARFCGRRPAWSDAWVVPLKDLVQVGLWSAAFLHHHVVWRGLRFRVLRDGRVEPAV